MKLLTLSIFCLLFVNLKSQTPLKPANPFWDKEALIKQSIEQLNREVVDSVLINSAFLRKQCPADPNGYFLAADVYQTIMRDYRVRRYESKFDSLINLAVKTARKALKTQRTAENYFILGAAEGYRCIHWFCRGKYQKVFSSAITCIKSLRLANKMKPEFVDPLLGLALYEYGQSKVIPLLLKSKRKNAILIMKRVQQEVRYVSINAMYALMMIYYETYEFNKAWQLNEQLFLKYPRNPVCLYNRALLLEKLERYSEAILIWKNLISHIEMFVQQSNNYLAECHFHVAQIYQGMGEPEMAIQELELAEMYVKLYQPEQEMDGPYTNFKDTRKAIQHARKKWHLSYNG